MPSRLKSTQASADRPPEYIFLHGRSLYDAKNRHIPLVQVDIPDRPEGSHGCILVPNRGIEANLTRELLRQQQAREEIFLDITNPK